MKEYGSNIQKLADYLVNIADRDTRTRQAYVLIELMRQLHPNMKEGQDYTMKLWDDLYIMSGFRLDVDSPFPPPSPEAIGKKPNRVPYPGQPLRYRHYGRNMELMVAKAAAMTDEQERWAFTSYIAKMMKGFYTAWNRDNADDSVVFEHLRDISGGKLDPEIEKIRTQGYLDVSPRDRYQGLAGATGYITAPQQILGRPGGQKQQPGRRKRNSGNNGQGGNTLPQNRHNNTFHRRRK